MSRVQPGAAVLAARDWAPLRGLRVGLVTNPSGVLPDGVSTIEALHRAPGVRLGALFGPEHGVRGDVPAGKYVASGRDARTGLPVYSLYGRTRRPAAAMLKNLDVLVFDIQDIGARSYTYLSTLGNVMEGAAIHKIPLVVLDRPNPLGGERVEGSPAEAGFRSFVGKYPVSYLHGMTLGELARMINARGWLPGGRRCDLTVIPCAGWTRTYVPWEEMGLPWVPTSPHVPHSDTPLFYAATGIVGELPTLSIGIGYPLPFELAGAPGLDADALLRRLDRRAVNGFAFRPRTWTPAYGVHENKRCAGVQILVEDAGGAALTRLNFTLMDVVRDLDGRRAFFAASARAAMFDKVCGTDRIRKAFQAGASGERLWALWNTNRDAFLAARKPYLLY